MNTENLKANYPKLISHMEDSGYADASIERIKSVITRILASPVSWHSYYDLYLEYESKSSRPTYPEMQTIIGTIMQFDVYGKYPNKQWNALIPNTAYDKLLPEFRMLIDCYVDAEQKRGRLKESTVHRNAKNASSFMLALQNAGINQLSDITEESVISVFMSEDGVQQKNSTYAYCIRDVLNVCNSHGHSDCKTILGLIPPVRRIKKNVRYLTPEESLKIHGTINNTASGLKLRDRAIGILAYYTGLRWCDIRAMDLESIDWNNDVIRITQVKTGVPLELPLTATVGNAIHEYLIAERPDVNNSALFLTCDEFPRRLGKMSGSVVSAPIIKAAGIRQGKGERRGFHLFRHHFTTSLLASGVPQVIISSVLGHLDPESIESYLSSDIVNLKKCGLSVELFQNTAEGGSTYE